MTFDVAEVPQLFIITGYSGAGKSSVLRALEDLGCLCIDNLPIALMPSFAQFVEQPLCSGQKVVLGIDIRAGQDMHELVREVTAWRTQKKYNVRIVFLTSSPDILLQRFQETRRQHPLGNQCSLSDALVYEKQLLKPLHDYADVVVDTDQFTIHQLRAFVRSVFLPETKPIMMVTLVSFGFKYGVPHESNFVYDIRALPNPHFVADLKAFDGMDARIVDYLFNQQEVKEYWQQLVNFINFSLKRSYQEGRLTLQIAIGCTGGRHRSVAFVQKLAALHIDYVQFFVKHRDRTRES